MNSLVDVYCISYNKPKRKQQMEYIFAKLDIPAYMYAGVGPEDPRMQEHPWISSCMLGHMDMVAKFYYESDKEYGIICEDDICIHDKLPDHIPVIIEECKKRDIDLVMLGYLMNYHIPHNGSNGHQFICDLTTHTGYTGHRMYTYTDDLWGGQMYMISKTYAKELVEKYGLEYGIAWNNALTNNIQNHNYICYVADFINTKVTPKRAVVYHPLCIENGDVDHYEHYGQRMFHKASYTMHVNEHFVGSYM